MGSTERYLMCPPEFFQVDYVINPWMEGNVDRANGPLAAEQWRGLHLLLAGQGKIELIPPILGSPDMVFTANAGLVLGDHAVLSRFLHRERQSEEPHFRDWFQQHGFRVHELPKDLPFEGAGDALFDRVRPLLWGGYGFRTELGTHALIAEVLSVEVVSLRLIDKRFYHLDTCLCPLERGFLMYYPPAFDARSNAQIERRIPVEKRLVLDEADATHFAANAVNIGETVVLHRASDALKSQLSAAGFQVYESPLSEFIKSGGAARCLTLRLNEIPKPGAHAHSEIASRVLSLEGHLLDSGLLDRALELTVESGGSFQILNFQLGKQRQSTSRSEIRVSAPGPDVLGNLVGPLIELGKIGRATQRMSDVVIE